jgi:hypothetical protein
MAAKLPVLVVLVALLASHLAMAAAQTPASSPTQDQLVPAVLPWGNLSQALQRFGPDFAKA